MNDCIFCQIVKGKIHAFIVYEDEKTVAFLDSNPSAIGHTMVILKKHAATLLDLDEEGVKQEFLTVKKMTETLKKTFKTDKFTIGINHGEEWGVPHLHVHIIPRFEGDGGGIIQKIVDNPPRKSLEVVAEKIKKNLNLERGCL